VGHGPTGFGNTISPKEQADSALNAEGVLPGLGRDAAPGWCTPRRREEARQGPSSLELGRHPTEVRKVGPNPRRAAGSTVVSYWLQLLTLEVIATPAVSRALQPALVPRSGCWASAPVPGSAGAPPHLATDTGVVLSPVCSSSPLRSSASPYWMTSFAWNRNVGGRVKPSALAVLRLTINSNLWARSTGKSAGLAPFRILSTKTAERWHRA
jgi:hypothetical protein